MFAKFASHFKKQNILIADEMAFNEHPMLSLDQGMVSTFRVKDSSTIVFYYTYDLKNLSGREHSINI